MATTYPARCECGRTHAVTAGDAGGRLPCECGRAFEVPSLRQLRAGAGEPTVSPELEVGAMLRDGHVPGAGECARCGAPGAAVWAVPVECERVQTKLGGWSINPVALVFGVLHIRATERREFGQTLAYRLPLRLCAACGRKASRRQLLAALRAVPEYRRLLEKYPAATAGRPLPEGPG